MSIASWLTSLSLVLAAAEPPSSAPPASPASPASPAGPSLFVLEDEPAGGCAARVHDVAARTARTLFVAPTCPAHVLFSPARNRMIHDADGRLWIRPLDDAKAAPTALGALPAGAISALYLTRTTRNVRVAMLAPVADKDVITRGGKTAYRFEGKELDATDLPSWGTPFVALLLELDARGAWKRVQAAATKSEAGDTPGIAVLDLADKAPDVVSLAQLLYAGTCVGGALECDVDDKAIAKLVGKDEDSAAGRTPKGAVPPLAFKVLYGDTPHAVPPLFLCEAGCTKGKKLDVSGDQLGLTLYGGHVLVAEEYSGNAPVVFDAKGRELLRLPRARSAVWWPTASSAPAAAAR